MPRNGSGVYSVPNTFTPNTVISSSQVNADFSDVGTALTNSIASDGQTTTTAAIPFAQGIETDDIAENTAGSGVTIDEVLLKDGDVTVGAAGVVFTDTITEKTAAAGVTVELVQLKDGLVDGVDIADLGSSVTVLTAEIDSVSSSVTVLQTDVSEIQTAFFRLVTAQSATGTSITFGSIPAGTSRINIDFTTVSHNASGGNQFVRLRLGDAGGVENSGYAEGIQNGSSFESTAGNAFQLTSTSAGSDAWNGLWTLVRQTGNAWCMSGNCTNGASAVVVEAGSKTLSAELTQLEFTLSGAASFDLGTIGVAYEGVLS